MHSIKDIHAIARFRPVDIDCTSERSMQKGIESCFEKKVLLSDHNLHKEDDYGMSRILAADGRYFFGKVGQCNDERYNFLHRNGDFHEHFLDYKNLSGLLVLEGEVSCDFPMKFRKIHNGYMVNEIVKSVGKTALVGLNNEFMEESYIAGRVADYILPHVVFEVPVIGGNLEQFEISLGVLTGMFVGSE